MPPDTTPAADLAGLVILVAEDEYLIADELIQVLHQFGARVLGPVGYLHEALLVLEAADRLDGAVLDIGLHGEAVYPLADALTARGVPYVFVTGYAAAAAIPARFRPWPFTFGNRKPRGMAAPLRGRYDCHGSLGPR